MRKKRRVLEEEAVYADPLPFRDVLSMIARYCTLQTFARLKRVCKSFLQWLPKEHPAIEMIHEGYSGAPQDFPFHVVPLVIDGYFRLFQNHFPDAAKHLLRMIDEPPVENGIIGVLRSDGSIWDCNDTNGYIFEDETWKKIEMSGGFMPDGTCKRVHYMMITD
jgi:hypothetical protein